MNLINIVTIVSAIFMIILILVQTRGATLGAGFGGGAEINTVRRGSDKTIFQMTIIAAFIFAGSIILNVVLA
jgi:preprotein translocase subunit SecG